MVDKIFITVSSSNPAAVIDVGAKGVVTPSVTVVTGGNSSSGLKSGITLI